MNMIQECLTVKEQCEFMSHIERKAQELGNTEEIYKDIYQMALRESGAYSLDYVKPKYLYNMHEAIDSYDLPSYLADKMEEGETDDGKNDSPNGDHELD